MSSAVEWTAWGVIVGSFKEEKLLRMQLGLTWRSSFFVVLIRSICFGNEFFQHLHYAFLISALC